ncbi:unnamed protein product [Rhizoctonia solani]|uniref:Uncharacterized protein n=1 Tax=Rhizoctonia solani TaxID=456999 RepID=A0A8H3A1G0_9AGAM|nr:unnamed protein product [Rhizoctonia solani]
MPRLSNRRKKQIASAHRALEGAKKWRARKRAEKARLEAADPSGSLAKGPSSESGSASAGMQDPPPRGSEIQDTPTGNQASNESSAAQVMGMTDDGGRRRSRRIRAR